MTARTFWNRIRSLWRSVSKGDDLDRTACFLLGSLMCGISVALLSGHIHPVGQPPFMNFVYAAIGLFGVYLLYVALFGTRKQLDAISPGDDVLLVGVAAVAIPLAMLLKWLQLRYRQRRRRRPVAPAKRPGVQAVSEVVAVVVGLATFGVLLVVLDWSLVPVLLFSCMAGAVFGAIFHDPEGGASGSDQSKG